MAASTTCDQVEPLQPKPPPTKGEMTRTLSGEMPVSEALAEVDPNLTMTNVRTLREQVNLAFDQERAVASLAGLFGIVALLLAAVGLYGVTAYTVA